jgi:hypothetical protein
MVRSRDAVQINETLKKVKMLREMRSRWEMGRKMEIGDR